MFLNVLNARGLLLLLLLLFLFLFLSLLLLLLLLLMRCLRLPLPFGEILYILGARLASLSSGFLMSFVSVESSEITHPRGTHLMPVMSVIDSPPTSDHLIERATAARRISTREPGLVGAYEVDHVDTGLKVSVGRHILVVSGRSNIVGEAQSVIMATKVHVDQALIGAVKGDAPLGHGYHGIEITHVGCQDHNTRVEEIGPSNIRRSSERLRDGKELFGSSVCYDIGIDVYDFRELSKLPEIDLGKSRMQIAAVH